MFISFFEYKTRQIDAVKDKPDFIKKYGKEFMRAFQEEMEYYSMKAIIEESVDLNMELDRIETKYRFNDDMNYLLDVTAQLLRKAILTEYWGLKKGQTSEDAKTQTREMCKIMMDQMNHSVHINKKSAITYFQIDDKLEQTIHDILKNSRINKCEDK